jgi:hypothetical protein
MNILMHANSITERGTTTALLDYCDGLQAMGFETTISWQVNHSTNSPLFTKHIESNYNANPYLKFSELYNKSKYFDCAYFLKGGEDDGKLLNTDKNLVHVVFQNFEPHGSHYVYVSKWLADSVKSNGAHTQDREFNFEYIPHIVELPSSNENMRDRLGIPPDAVVGIRIGGYDTFDIKFSQRVVKTLLVLNSQIYFIFVNTRKFTDHPRAIFVDQIFGKQQKSNFLETADFFIHARSQGESFGISIVEAMACGVPVFAWEGGLDRNHVALLSPNSLYKNFLDLLFKISNLNGYTDIERNIVEAQEYLSGPVMRKFIKVFELG